MQVTCLNCRASCGVDDIICPQCGVTMPLRQDTSDQTRQEINTTLLLESVGKRLDGSPASYQDFLETLRMKAVKDPTPASVVGSSDELPKESIPDDAIIFRIGYSRDNDLVIPITQVSSHHAILAYSTQGIVLRDQNSTNGTFVNGRRILSAAVGIGDRIGLGSYEFVLNPQLIEKLKKKKGSAFQATQAVPQFLIGKKVVIGRDSDCDIVLDAPQISRKHIELTLTVRGWELKDLNSANGTYVNERHETVQFATVTEHDVVFLGSYRLPVRRILDFLDTGKQSVHSNHLTQLPVDKEIITIGRGADNDVVIDGPQISRHHAQILRVGEMFFLEDLGSANGTYIDGQKITTRALFRDGQTISLGSYTIRFDLSRGTVHKSYRGDILLQAEGIKYDIATRHQNVRILDDISFTAYPTEFIGLLGPSGSGKTTLLMALIGYIRPTRGRTLVNGEELMAHYDRYRGSIGYVPQEDIIHSQLTPYEALYYTAKLRLPPDTTDEEIDRRIQKVLAELEIVETQHIQIGSPERKGISGGQRKRVNLALELLTEPSLLCLDEPTSGLASEDTLNVMRLLRQLADGGRTILLTIHQPSMQAYRLLDNTIYLADGEQVYYGPAYPDSLFYFHPKVETNTPEAEQLLADPGACMRPIMEAKRAGEPMETLAARYRRSKYHEEFVSERRKNRTNVSVTGKGERRPPRFSFRQLKTLSQRYFNIKLKDRMGTFVLLIQAPLVAMLLNLVFMTQAEGLISRMQFTPFALFLMVISAVWFGCSNAAREIVGEQAIYKRERMVNLSVAAYVGSKFVVLGLLCLIQCITLVAMTFFVLDFWGNPFHHLGILWLCSLAGVAMGLLLSASVRTTEAAMAIVPLLLIPQVILGGAIMPVDRMSTPTYLASYAVVSRWGFEGVIQAEHLSDAYEIDSSAMVAAAANMVNNPHQAPLSMPQNPLDRFFGASETSLGMSIVLMAGFMIVLLVGVGAILIWREDR